MVQVCRLVEILASSPLNCVTRAIICCIMACGFIAPWLGIVLAVNGLFLIVARTIGDGAQSLPPYLLG